MMRWGDRDGDGKVTNTEIIFLFNLKFWIPGWRTGVLLNDDGAHEVQGLSYPKNWHKNNFRKQLSESWQFD